MWYQVVLPPLLLIPILMTINCNHTSKTDKDVIVTYSNHAEADPKPKEVEANTEIQIIIPEKLITEKTIPEERRERDQERENQERDSDEVVFIPNERNIERNEDYLRNNPIRVEDYMARTIDDVMDNGQVRVETESPADIIFFSGKNNEHENTKEGKKAHGDARRTETEIEKAVLELNCTDLNCNNTVASVCGGKVEHKQWRYRLFLNECFFKKVNCYFKHETNRYHLVSLSKCQNIAAHVTTRPSFFQLYPPAPVHKVTDVKSESVKLHNNRRSFASRRSSSMSVDGKSCSHTCPATCPDDYQPQCAVSGAGRRRVFENHCKLDYNSCAFGVVWRARPLAECVGGKRADMRQNRGFIDWMQRVGIVDNKGRLVLS